jgi:hypothetical protein
MLKKIPWATMCFALVSYCLGLISYLLLLKLFQPKGWILNTDSVNFDQLTPQEQAFFRYEMIQGNIFSTADLLGNFTSYYHSLISLLIALLVLVVGFITVKFQKSKAEHDELLQVRTNNFFNNIEKNMADEDFTAILEQYENLNEYLRRKIVSIIQNEDLDSYNQYVIDEYKSFIEHDLPPIFRPSVSRVLQVL